jgi:hypothetical protein
MMLDAVVDNNGSSGGAFQRARPGLSHRDLSVGSRERMIILITASFGDPVTLGYVGVNTIRHEDCQAFCVDLLGMEQVDIAGQRVRFKMDQRGLSDSGRAIRSERLLGQPYFVTSGLAGL